MGPAGRAEVEDARNKQQESKGAPAGPSAPGQSAREPAGAADSSAEESGPPFTFVEPPYPISAERLDGRSLTPADDELVRQWWATRAALQAKADAARAWAEHVDQVARTQHAPSAQASRAAGLVRALTRPEGLPPSTVNLQVDPVSGWARTTKDELLPPSTLAAIAKTLPGRRGSVRPERPSEPARHHPAPHPGRPDSRRPRPPDPSDLPEAARTALRPGRRTLPLPQLHRDPPPARPPRPVLAQRRPHGPRQPRQS